jgi:HD-like signal output (HDOD) protein/CheY-like chemotaxis protein
MKNILFVDDEPHVLASLKTLLRKQRHEWRMEFVPSGQAALTALLAVSYDVIVSDMRMPGMDGATLLAHVKEDYPHMVRIVLSGQTEQEVSRRLVHVAHQFLSKPCAGPDIQQAIERACGLQELLEQPALRRVVGQIGQLPIRPATYSRLIHLLADPAASVADVARVIERDVGTSTKILQVVNSAFVGISARVGEIDTAVSYLGLEMVKILALSTGMRGSQVIPPCPGIDLDAIESHAMLSGQIARRLLQDKIDAQDAFTAAILQDTGLLVLMARLPEAFHKLVDEARMLRRSLYQVEFDSLGVTHAEIGAYLLGIWGLPYSIVEAVAHHHRPQRVPASAWGIVGAVHVACVLADEVIRARAKSLTGA